MGRPTEMDVIQNILQQSQTYRDNPRKIICSDPVTEAWEQQQQFRILSTVFDQVRMSNEIKNIIATIYLDFGLESLRAVEGMELCSRTHAALHNRSQVLIEDLMATVPLVLAHRVDLTTLENILKYLDFAHFNQSIPTMPPTMEKQCETRIITGCSTEVQQKPAEESATSPALQPGMPSKINIWQKLRNMLKSLNTKGQTGSNPSPPNTRQPALQKRKGGSGRTGNGQGSIGDPRQMPIVAPNEQARPLSQLSVRQYISTEEDIRPHD
jgi:magnesium chelatase subunit I